MHGGSRVNNVQVCVMCHNPNLSSSGRTVNPATANPVTVAVLGADPLTWPEATNNFRSMIHGIHAAPVRDVPFQFVRNRSNGLYYNWSEVKFPGNLMACEKCHRNDADHPATYNPKTYVRHRPPRPLFGAGGFFTPDIHSRCLFPSGTFLRLWQRIHACLPVPRGDAGGSAGWAGTLLSRIPEMNQECPR